MAPPPLDLLFACDFVLAVAATLSNPPNTDLIDAHFAYNWRVAVF